MPVQLLDTELPASQEITGAFTTGTCSVYFNQLKILVVVQCSALPSFFAEETVPPTAPHYTEFSLTWAMLLLEAVERFRAAGVLQEIHIPISMLFVSYNLLDLLFILSLSIISNVCTMYGHYFGSGLWLI